MTLEQQIQNWIKQRQQKPCHRQLVVISGEKDWGLQTAEFLLTQLEFNANSGKPTLAIGLNELNTFDFATHISNKDYRRYLGRETQCVVYNCWAGMRANALSALSGTIVQSGLMILVCPTLENWPQYRDNELEQRVSFGYQESFTVSYFTKWLLSHIKADPQILLVTPENLSGGPVQLPQAPANISQLAPCATKEQYDAVEAIVKVATGHRNRPLVIQADRGRGKSTAIGIACAELISQHNKRIILTAPHKTNSEQTFAMFERLSNQTDSLQFWAIDALIEQNPKADLVIIDEAAALPSELLKQLCTQYRRIVFSTTIHGYEGSGRGFEIRFKDYLKTQFPEYREHKLHQPIRWAENDPLEQFWFKVFAYKTDSHQQIEQTNFHGLVSQEELINKPYLLYQVFSLLVNAHYQTSPDTLVSLLDSPDHFIFVSLTNGQLMATAVVTVEGGSALKPLSQDIAFGKRRPNGHLLAQKLAYSMSAPNLATLKYVRIVRIAVEQENRRKKTGSELLKVIQNWASSTQKAQYMGASFGADTELLNFWLNNKFQLVQLGLKKETATGEFNAIVLKEINGSLESIIPSMQASLKSLFLFYLSSTYQHLPYSMVMQVLINLNVRETLSPQQQTELHAFANSQRSLPITMPSIGSLALNSVIYSELMPELMPEQKALFIQYILQRHTVSSLANSGLIKGKKDLEKHIREISKLALITIQKNER